VKERGEVAAREKEAHREISRARTPGGHLRSAKNDFREDRVKHVTFESIRL